MRLVDGVALFLTAVVVLMLLHDVKVECFNDLSKDAEARTKTTQMVLGVFMDVMRRPPSPAELDAYVKRVTLKGLTQFQLETILLNSDEYLRDVKNQSDDPQAELRRVVSEQYVLTHVVDMFQDVKGKQPVPQVIMPLKDMYQLLGPQDDERFRAFLGSKFYPDWENDVLMRQSDDSYNTKTTLDVFNLWYRGDNLSTRGGQDDATTLAHAAASTEFGTFHHRRHGDDDDDEERSDRHRRRPEPCAVGVSKPRDLAERDPDVGAQIAGIQEQNKTFRLYFNPQTDLVLDPSLRWKAPEAPPPVCTTLGQPQDAQPYVVVNGELVGTPLLDAAHTDVGSILPKFEYRQYVEIPEDQVKIVKHEDAVDAR